MLRTATRDAFVKLIDEAIAEAVDFMVIAGDLYDGNWKDYNTGHFFCREMGRLGGRESGLPAVRQPRRRKRNDPPAYAAVQRPGFRRASRPASSSSRSGWRFTGAASGGRDHREPRGGLPAAEPGWFNIGVLHTALEGNAAHAGYARARSPSWRPVATSTGHWGMCMNSRSSPRPPGWSWVTCRAAMRARPDPRCGAGKRRGWRSDRCRAAHRRCAAMAAPAQ